MAIFRVTEFLSFGDEGVCNPKSYEQFSVVHACKEPCHRHGVGYKDKSLATTHPNYLSYEKPGHLYLNMIDPPIPLFKAESFQIFFDYVDREIKQRPILIHCNQGQSRAPSLTMLYMAKRLGLLPNESFQAARKEFEKTLPYTPGKGIVTFLEQKWASLGA